MDTAKGSSDMWRKRFSLLLLSLLAVGLIAAACSSDDDGDGGGTLEDVQDRGSVVVGVKDSQPGFGNLEPDGSFSGQDVEFGRAVAAAIFGNANAIEFVVASAADRFELLASEEIDVLIRTTTWTSSRDIDLKSQFVATTFYDGQGVLVSSDSPFQSIDDLQGATVCVTGGTTTETNLASVFAQRGIDHTGLSFAGDPEVLAAFTSGRCDAWTADKGNLAAQRASFPESEGGPDAVRILPETISKEPLGPVVRDGDTEWFDVIQWTVFGTMVADELGVNSQNVQDMAANPPSQAIANLLGASFDGAPVVPFGESLGLDATFMQDVIFQVGNYDQIYSRTIAQIGLARANSLNAIWTEGGLIYAPPIK
jgi:general L-amino acid transport system substrate-binding protein